MAKVFLKKADYEYRRLKPLVFEIIDSISSHEIAKGARVLIKPNLLAPATSDRALLTHPLIVKSVVEYVLDHGGKPQVSDSPAMGSFDKIIRESGIREALGNLPVDLCEFKSSIKIDVGDPFNKIEIAADALAADVVINLPKLKTHSQMLLTLGVKNLFGCVVGLRKPEWHMRTGVNRDLFAALLVKICQAVNPAITILDGVLAMEGQGPGKGGTPRVVGVIMGSADPVALDMAVCNMLSLDYLRVPTNHAAERAGLIKGPPEIVGDRFHVEDFKLPEIGDLVFGPRKAQKLMRKHLTRRPTPDESLCKMCGECMRYCPAKAIEGDAHHLRFDYDKCIRCYCCIEVCPHGALSTEEPWLGKLFSRTFRKS